MYGIMRLQKIKSTYSLMASLRHAYREQDTPNADPKKSKKNIFVGPRSVNQAIAAYERRKSAVKGKVRANAVMAIEYLITASPMFFEKAKPEQKIAFFNRGLQWLKNTYGHENVVCAGVHEDENSPHMWVYIIPIHNEKLNARHYIGGHKNRLSEMQTDFHQHCCAEFGLSRGVEKSRAKHVEVRHWYTVMRQVLDLPKKTTTEKIRAILGGELNQIAQGAAANAAIARQAVERSHRAVQALKTAQNRAESVLDRLAASERLNRAYEAERIKQAEYLRELETLRELVDRHRDLIVKAERLGLKQETAETGETDVLTSEAMSSHSLKR